MPLPPAPFRRDLVEALAVLLPASCPACRNPGAAAVCPACLDELARAIEPVPRILDPGGAPLPVRTSAPFAGTARRLVLALKEEGRRSAAPPLARLLGPALAAAIGSVPAAPVEVAVPPASWGRRVRRGFDPVALLVREAGADARSVLRRRRATRDQSGLDRAQRADNLRGAFVARRRLDGRRFVLADDIVTTGSTLLEMRRAIEEAGGSVLGAATILRTPLRTGHAADDRRGAGRMRGSAGSAG